MWVKEMDREMIALNKEQEKLNHQIWNFTERLNQYEQGKQNKKSAKISDAYFRNIVNHLNASIGERLKTSNRYKEYLMALQQIDDAFFTGLKEKKKTGSNVSPKNWKYCLAFAIGMDTNDIACCMDVEPRSVHMARHRLKLKFQLDKSVDFDLFLKQWIS